MNNKVSKYNIEVEHSDCLLLYNTLTNENMILLTATQHNTKAHPNNRTQEISRDYQLTCLLAKADTIEKSLQRFGEKYYRKESFVYVINTGLDVTIAITLTLSEIKQYLIQIYNNTV